MKPFINFFIYFFVVFIFMLGMVLFSQFVKNFFIYRKMEPGKELPYESGVPARGEVTIRFGIRFWTIALLFLLFDVEVAYLYPWAYYLNKLGIFGLVEGLIFIGILLLGYLFILKEGGIKWTS